MFCCCDLTEEPKSNLFQVKEIHGQGHDPGLPGRNGHGARGVSETGLRNVRNLIQLSLAGRNDSESIP
jgi:hypothetical protein